MMEPQTHVEMRLTLPSLACFYTSWSWWRFLFHVPILYTWNV